MRWLLADASCSILRYYQYGLLRFDKDGTRIVFEVLHATSLKTGMETLDQRVLRTGYSRASQSFQSSLANVLSEESDDVMKIIRVLVIEDSQTHLQLIRGMLSRTKGAAFAVEAYQQLSTGLSRLGEGEIDVILLDLTLPDSEGVESFERVAAQAPDLPIVVLTGVDDEEVALSALHSGAQDYLIKGQIDGNLLARSLRYAIERKNAELEVERARDELELRVEQRTAELREMQEASRLQQEELAHVSRLNTLGEMASGIAHELNQPLMAVTGFSDVCLQLLDSNNSDRGQLKELLTDIASESQRAAEIIKRLRKLVTKRPTQKLRCDLNELVKETVSLLDKQARASFELNLSNDLPNVRVDRVQIQQVLLNLTTNALQAMASCSGGPQQLTIRTGTDKGTVFVEVSDTGAGLSTEDFDRLFQPFFTRKPNGLGLGLSISRSIIEAHSGELTARRNTGRGMTFLFTLPIARKTENAVAPADK